MGKIMKIILHFSILIDFSAPPVASVEMTVP